MDTIARNKTTADVAEFLGITTRHVLRLCHKGALPHNRLGPKTVRFNISEIVNLLNSTGRWIDVRTEPTEIPTETQSLETHNCAVGR